MTMERVLSSAASSSTSRTTHGSGVSHSFADRLLRMVAAADRCV